MKEVKITTIRGKQAEDIGKVLDEEGILIYRQRSEFGSEVLDVFTETENQNLQRLIHKLNEGYEEYKKNHPEFAKVVEKEEGKPEESYGQDKKTNCETCGEWLQGFDMCPECGRINK